MKKLLLIRHAKASHDTNFNDFERPLKQLGIEDAAVMAQRLHAQSIIPQILITSPALRTLSTANIFAEHLSLTKPVEMKEIYDAGLKTLLNIIEGLPDKYDTIALVGHNPAVSDVLYYLTGKPQDMHPCAIAVIDFNIDSWQLISENTGELVWYSTPKQAI
jgi:phosphohistidine phosphatase